MWRLKSIHSAPSRFRLSASDGGHPITGLLQPNRDVNTFRFQLLEGSECELIFRMKTLRDGEFVPDDGGYAVHVDETRTRYASGKNGIVVDVQGRAVTIQSIAAADDEEIPEDPTM